MTDIEIKMEFGRQIEVLVQKGYPEKAGLGVGQFLKLIRPLKDKIEGLSVPEMDLERGRLPLAVVVKNNLIATEEKMNLIEREGINGVTKLKPLVAADFAVIDGMEMPASKVYLLVDIDRGRESLNLAPEESLGLIKKANRLPLTIDEGVAIVTVYPEFLMRNNCFSLLGSRHAGDKRVPAIWLNGKNEPNLGWCWNGNPHTWLGSASGKMRID